MSASPTSDSHLTDHDAGLNHRTAEGAIFLPDGRRVAAWSEVSLRMLHRSLAPESPDAARLLLYRAGYEWGLQELLRLSQRFREESGGGSGAGFWHMDAATVFDRWSAPLAIAGWGTWTVDRSAHASGITVVELHHSAIAAALMSPPTPGEPAARELVEPVCHLYAGLFAGAVSFYDRAEAHAVETDCIALGHDCCRFLVGSGATIDRAETARREGAAHDAILRAAIAPPAPPPAGAPAAPPAAAKPGNSPWRK